MSWKIIANEFGMTAASLAKSIGYSRQGLYMLVDSSPKNKRFRIMEIVEKLTAKSEELYRLALKNAHANYARRCKLLEELSDVAYGRRDWEG